MKPADKIRNYCKTCYKTTNHTVLKVEQIDGPSDYQESIFYAIVKCNGCDTLSYRTEVVDYEQTEQYDQDNWGPAITITTYPQVLEGHQSLNDYHYLPNDIKIIYREALSAFSAKCYLLTAVAFRGIIEAICKDKSIVGKDLSIQISKMAKNGLITEKEAERLHAVRFLGNDSIHEMSVPKPKQLLIVLGIIEHLLKNLYLIDNELKSNLDTIIQNFTELKYLLTNQISQFEIGEMLPLKKILGKSIRRLHDKARNLEIELQEKIRNGEYKYLKLGELMPHQDPAKGKVQFYEVVNNIPDFDDLF